MCVCVSSITSAEALVLHTFRLPPTCYKVKIQHIQLLFSLFFSALISSVWANSQCSGDGADGVIIPRRVSILADKRLETEALCSSLSSTMTAVAKRFCLTNVKWHIYKYTYIWSLCVGKNQHTGYKKEICGEKTRVQLSVYLWITFCYLWENPTIYDIYVGQDCLVNFWELLDSGEISQFSSRTMKAAQLSSVGVALVMTEELI